MLLPLFDMPVLTPSPPSRPAVSCNPPRCFRPLLPGDRYEGEWADGLQSGTGTFLLADGSIYYASWQDGRMHGKCVYMPPRPADGAG
jgi:hypothetical protein